MDGNFNLESKSAEATPKAAHSFSSELVQSELDKILASRTFRAAHGQKKFLAYAVEQALAGNAHLLKEYVVATEALGRDESFDPRLDPIVRTEARKLRARLAKYYETEGAGDPLRIEFRKGSYVPVFHHPAEIRSEETAIGERKVDSSTAPSAETSALPAPLPPPAPADATPAAEPTTLASSAATASSTAPSTRLTNSPWRPFFAYLSTALLAVCLIAIFYRLSGSRFSTTIFAANDPSVAVLPLVDLSNDADGFTSYRLTNEISDALRQAPGLRVVAQKCRVRLQASPEDLRQLGQRLGVRAVLVGNVTRSANHLKITIQLNNTETGNHLWSGSYERDPGRLGTIAPEIATAVSNVLGVGIAGREQNIVELPASPNRAANDDYLRGLYFRKRVTEDSLNKAIGYFKQAIAEDPSFARAYAGLADCYAMERSVAAIPPLEVAPLIEAAASEALQLDPKLGEPHINLAVSAEYRYDWATAEREFKKGLELSPDSVIGHLWYAWYLVLVGRNDQVLAQRKVAAELDPVSPYAVDAIGLYYSAVGRYENAVEEYRSALTLEPNFGLVHQDLGEAYLFQGKCENAIAELRIANESMPGPRRKAHLAYAYGVCGHADDARRILRDFLAERRSGVIPAFAVAEVYLGLSDKDAAFHWLERAIDERDLGVTLKSDQHFSCIRSDPRFQLLLHRMKLG